MHVLDFWLGDWLARDSTGSVVGTNKVHRILDGCAIEEDWRDPDGTGVRGLLYYVNTERRWSYVLVTPHALGAGGVKERHLIARRPDGGVRFQGEWRGVAGPVLDRMTLIPEQAGHVREVVELSRDGGVTWFTTFDATYYPESVALPQ